MQMEELSYEQRVEEFYVEMKKRGVVSLYGSYFSDDPRREKGSKYHWYRKECIKLAEEVQTNATISEERMKEIIEFSKIEKYKKEHLEKRKMSVLEKASEYREKVLELGRDIKESDGIYFSNGERMKGWLYSANCLVKKDLESDTLLTEERIEEIDALGELNFLVNDVFPKKQRLSFDEKASEYLVKLYELGRDIEEKDSISFSNGENMPRWLDFQVKNLRITTMRDGHMNEHKFSVLANIFDCKQRIKEESMADDSSYEDDLNQYVLNKMRKYHVLKAYHRILTSPKTYQKTGK